MKRYDQNIDYCGPGNGLLTRWISNRPWGARINRCCYWHDKAYETGGTGKDRAHVDEIFYKCVRKRLVAKWWIPGWFADMVAMRHYMAVRTFGSGSFNYKA